MAETNPMNYVGSDARRALEVFSDDFRSALAMGPVNPWAKMLGYDHNSDSMQTTFPLPYDAAGYVEFKGDMRYRSLFSRSITVEMRQWQDGVKELARKIEQDKFIGWAGQPAAMALEALRAPNKWLVERLVANPYIDLYSDRTLKIASSRAMFASDHPYNVFEPGLGSFDNDATGDTDNPFTDESEDLSTTYFGTLPGPNGEIMGLQKTHVLVSPHRATAAKNFYSQDTLVRTIKNAAGTENVAAVTQSNIYQGTVEVIVAPELTNPDVYYELALNKPGLYPWVIQTAGAPEEIVQDKSSSLYAEKLQVSISYILDGAAELAMPHAIRRVTLS